ncbi:hypothetical protein LCGC14_1174140 [marine sediment metagenome]|uniref:Uncharacterized protein n=1 Tax=marine sediment metagenome TaxID=412755 RepID=A0A0F9LTX0_9ZZZZ
MAGKPGSYNVATHTEASATATTSAALAASDKRAYAMFQNDGDNDVYLRLGEAAIKNEGILINANGGSYEISDRLGNLFLGAVNCITASGTSVVLVLEGTN